MPTPKPVTMTNAEAEALYQAACYVITRDWGSTDEEERALKRAISKLRRASTLIIEHEE